MVSGDPDKETQTEELFGQAFPRESDPPNNLAVNACLSLGQFEMAIQKGNEAIWLNPYVPGAYGAVACGYLGLNRAEEAKSFLENAMLKVPEHGAVHFYLYIFPRIPGR